MTTTAFYLAGLAPYAEMAEAQERLVEERIADRIGDTVLFLEHLPVVTMGKRSDPEDLLKPVNELAANGVAVFRTSRGGEMTYHAPGQIVMYPVLKLGGSEADAHDYTHRLEEVAIRTAADFGVRTFRRKGMTGAWTEEGKIAAIGVRLKRWTTSHGMSFNVNIDLSGFDLIVPCGLKGERVTSLRAILGDACPVVPSVREHMARHFSDVFERKLMARSANACDFLRQRQRLTQGLR